MLVELISGIWIGDINSAFNQKFYQDNLISTVINCTLDKGFINYPLNNKVRLPISHNITPERDIKLLEQNVIKIVDFINKKAETDNIFIYCYDGCKISPLIVAIYMLKYGDISKDDIHNILKSKNDKICIDFDLSRFY